MTHWSDKYLGIPWVKGGTSHDGFDCYGLATDVQRSIYGRIMPKIDTAMMSLLSMVKAIKRHRGWSEWERMESPVDGCIVKLIKSVEPDHIGIWVDADGGGVLHSCRHNGVWVDRLAALRIMGWCKWEFWGYRGANA